MKQRNASSLLPRWSGYVAAIGLLVLVCSVPAYVAASVGYTETKGPFKNWTQVVDLDEDGDLDVVVSHTRWEDVDLSWSGVGRWINQGDGTFELVREEKMESFAGFAGGAGDVDQDGDVDIFVQDFETRLLMNQGGQDGDEPGKFKRNSGIQPPPSLGDMYRDGGGAINMGDLNGDGRVDAFLTGCCYGADPARPGDYPHAPSISWVWINDGREDFFQKGHIFTMDFLDGRPIRQAALGDLDGDGDLDAFAAVGKPTMGAVTTMDDLILLNDGTGKLALYDQPLGNTDSTSVALGDMNGDRTLDALVGTSDSARLWINQSNALQVGGPMFVPAGQSFDAARTIRNRLGTAFSAATGKWFGLYLPYGSIRIKAVFLSDLDGDRDLDALIARLWGAEIWWNDGTGRFERSEVHISYPEDTGVAVADFDGDGDPDIFTGRNEARHEVWWNNGNGTFQPGR